MLSAKASDYKVPEVHRVSFVQGFVGQRYPGGDSPRQNAPVAPMHPQTLAPAGYVSITWFGKRHYISLALFEKDADKYHELHWKEAFIVLDSIEGNKAIYDQWANPSDFFGACTSEVVYAYDGLKQQVKAWVSDVQKAPKPDLKEFDKLTDRAYVIIERLAKETHEKLEADKMARNGLELEQLWQDAKALVAVTEKFRETAIESAEHVTAGLETVESTSFQLLNLVPTITFMDPIREAVYKISVLLLRASARGVGGLTAWGTTDAAFREAFGVLMREGPGVIVDVVLAPVSRLFNSLGYGPWKKRVATIVVQQVLEFTCWYYKTMIENDGKEISDKQWEDMLYDRLYSLIGSVLGEMFGTNLGKKAKDLLIKATTETVIRELTITAIQSRRIAKEQDREYVDVIMGELPSMIMRIFQGVIVGTIQRRAQQSGQFVEQQRATRGEDGDFGGTDFHEAKKILEETDVGEFARKGTPSKETIKAIQRDRNEKPVSVFTWHKYNQEGWKDSNLDYKSAQAERRYADNNNVCIIGMDPAATRTLHTDTPEARGATGPKPMGVKAKSSNNGNAPIEVRGLVVKPIDEGRPGGPTHKNYADAVEKWKKEQAGLFEGGFLVKPNGVVFHPDQLERWGQLHPEDKPMCDLAVRTLKEAAKNGYHDLSEMPPPGAKITSDLSGHLDEIQPLLKKAKVGYYSDLDLVEVVDFGSGKRRFMGDLGEKKEVLNLARDNREHMNDDLNIHDYDDPDLPKDVHALARQGDAVQHGANNEILSKKAEAFTPDGKDMKVYLDSIHMVFPKGELIRLNEGEMKKRGYSYEGLDRDARMKRLDSDIRVEVEKELKNRLGDKYTTFANRAETVRKGYSKKSPRYKVKGKKPEPVTTEQLETIGKLFNGVEVLDEPGLSRPIPSLDVLNSLRCRGLSVYPSDVTKFLEHPMTPSELDAFKDRHGTEIGVEMYELKDGPEKGLNVVIAACHYRQSIPEVLEALMRTRAIFGTVAANLTFWYEMYTAYRPVTTDWVRDRIGGGKCEVPASAADIKGGVSSFKPKKDERLYAFCVSGFDATYKKAKHNEIKDPRPIQGLVLTDVWENMVTKDHDYRTTLMSGDRKVLMMLHSLVGVPLAALTPKQASIELAKEGALARAEHRRELAAATV